MQKEDRIKLITCENIHGLRIAGKALQHPQPLAIRAIQHDTHSAARFTALL